MFMLIMSFLSWKPKIIIGTYYNDHHHFAGYLDQARTLTASALDGEYIKKIERSQLNVMSVKSCIQDVRTSTCTIDQLFCTSIQFDWRMPVIIVVELILKRLEQSTRSSVLKLSVILSSCLPFQTSFLQCLSLTQQPFFWSVSLQSNPWRWWW